MRCSKAGLLGAPRLRRAPRSGSRPIRSATSIAAPPTTSSTAATDDIGAFDSPKHAGLPLGQVTRVAPSHIDLELDDATTLLSNGDGLTYLDLQNNLVGLQVNTATALGGRAWRIEANEPVDSLKGLRTGTRLQRNRDMAWDRLLAKKSAERRIGVTMRLSETATGFALALRDADGIRAHVELTHEKQPARDAAKVEPALREHLGRLGNTIFAAERIDLELSQPWFVPASALNVLRRDAVAALESARAAALQRPPRAAAVEPPVPYPGDALTYLANVVQPEGTRFLRRARRADRRCRLREPRGSSATSA